MVDHALLWHWQRKRIFFTNCPFKYSQEFLSYFISAWLSNVSITLRCLSKPRIFSTDLIPQFSLRSFFIASVTQILRCENRPKNFSYLKGLFIKSISVVYSSISIIFFCKMHNHNELNAKSNLTILRILQAGALFLRPVPISCTHSYASPQSVWFLVKYTLPNILLELVWKVGSTFWNKYVGLQQGFNLKLSIKVATPSFCTISDFWENIHLKLQDWLLMILPFIYSTWKIIDTCNSMCEVFGFPNNVRSSTVDCQTTFVK